MEADQGSDDGAAEKCGYRRAGSDEGEHRQKNASGEKEHVGLAYERENFLIALATQDRREGVAAFLEKRDPEFTGQ